MLKPCDSTQLDFIAEQCSQTDLQPLYLQPNIASFYTWIPAVGFVMGTAPKSPFSQKRRAENKSPGTFHVPSSIAVTTRGGTVPVHVPVRRREFHREPRLSVCGRHSLCVRQSASVWLNSCLYKRHMSGGDDSARPNRRNVPLRLMLFFFFF